MNTDPRVIHWQKDLDLALTNSFDNDQPARITPADLVGILHRARFFEVLYHSKNYNFLSERHSVLRKFKMHFLKLFIHNSIYFLKRLSLEMRSETLPSSVALFIES